VLLHQQSRHSTQSPKETDRCRCRKNHGSRTTITTIATFPPFPSPPPFALGTFPGGNPSMKSSSLGTCNNGRKLDSLGHSHNDFSVSHSQHTFKFSRNRNARPCRIQKLPLGRHGVLGHAGHRNLRIQIPIQRRTGASSIGPQSHAQLRMTMQL
jgi:hypothetical protein